MLIEYTFRLQSYEEIPAGRDPLIYEAEILANARDELFAQCRAKGLNITYEHVRAYVALGLKGQQKNEFVTININYDSDQLLKLRNEFPQEFSDVALALYLEV
jgi:hypothetical protein